MLFVLGQTEKRKLLTRLTILLLLVPFYWRVRNCQCASDVMKDEWLNIFQSPVWILLKWERAILQLNHYRCYFRIFYLRRFLTFWKQSIYLFIFNWDHFWLCLCFIPLLSMFLKFVHTPILTSTDLKLLYDDKISITLQVTLFLFIYLFYSWFYFRMTPIHEKERVRERTCTRVYVCVHAYVFII